MPCNVRVPRMASGPDGRWTLGIGDPSPMGWITLCAYGVAAALAWRNAQAAHRTALPTSFWFSLLGLMLLLGLNKQLDLQTWFGQTGRDLALAQGWYEKRRYVQGAFILLLCAGAVAALVWARSHWAARWREYRWVLGGVALLFVFIVVRAATFHHLEDITGLALGGSTVARWLEISAVVLVGMACGHWHSQHQQRVRRFAIERYKDMS
jgi:hypothetical protein